GSGSGIGRPPRDGDGATVTVCWRRYDEYGADRTPPTRANPRSAAHGHPSGPRGLRLTGHRPVHRDVLVLDALLPGAVRLPLVDLDDAGLHQLKTVEELVRLVDRTQPHRHVPGRVLAGHPAHLLRCELRRTDGHREIAPGRQRLQQLP